MQTHIQTLHIWALSWSAPYGIWCKVAAVQLKVSPGDLQLRARWNEPPFTWKCRVCTPAEKQATLHARSRLSQSDKCIVIFIHPSLLGPVSLFEVAWNCSGTLSENAFLGVFQCVSSSLHKQISYRQFKIWLTRWQLFYQLHRTFSES